MTCQDNWGPGFERASTVDVCLAAPALARALCLVERTGIASGCGYDVYETEGCGGCAEAWRCPIDHHHGLACPPPMAFAIRHRTGCPLDAALTAAGLGPDERKAVRMAQR